MICHKSYVAEREQETTGRSGVGDKALAFKPIGRGFAPRQPFLFFTRPRRRRVLIYQSYYRREEKNTRGRSGVGVRCLNLPLHTCSFLSPLFGFFTRRKEHEIDITLIIWPAYFPNVTKSGLQSTNTTQAFVGRICNFNMNQKIKTFKT